MHDLTNHSITGAMMYNLIQTVAQLEKICYTSWELTSRSMQALSLEAAIHQITVNYDMGDGGGN